MSRQQQVINIGDYCVGCGEDTSPGSGRWVNRIPADCDLHEGHPAVGESYEYGLVIAKVGDRLDGYMCAECQAVECETCGQPTIEYSMRPEGGVICDECNDKEAAA